MYSCTDGEVDAMAALQVVVVAGTKADLPGRRVQVQEAQQWAASKGFLHFEVGQVNKHVHRCPPKHTVELRAVNCKQHTLVPAVWKLQHTHHACHTLVDGRTCQ
jgi:hypothetical protein